MEVVGEAEGYDCCPLLFVSENRKEFVYGYSSDYDCCNDYAVDKTSLYRFAINW